MGGQDIQQDSDEAASDTDSNSPGGDRNTSLPKITTTQKLQQTNKKNAGVVNKTGSSHEESLSDLSEISLPEICSDLSSVGSSELSLLNRKYSYLDNNGEDSPNCKRDFASKVTTPGEGKETGLPECVFFSNDDSGSNRDNSNQNNKNEKDSSAASKQQLPKNVLIFRDKPLGLAEPAIKSPTAETCTSFSAECQTGTTADDGSTCFDVLTRDRLARPTNILCYASRTKGDAAVQITTPDLILRNMSSTSSSSSSARSAGGSEDGGYAAEVSESSSMSSNKVANNDANESNDDALSGDDDDGMSVSGCSLYPRVGSARSHKVFLMPPPDPVSVLYGGLTTQESSSAAASANEEPTAAKGSPRQKKGV